MKIGTKIEEIIESWKKNTEWGASKF